MSDGVQIVRALAIANPDLVLLVPATRIAGGIFPQGTPLPYVSLQSVSSVDRNILAPGARRRVTERVQATVVAATYPSLKEVQKAFKRACADQLPVIDDVTAVVVHSDGAGPDFTDASASLFIGSRDFRVSYNEVR
jgi:hypothetical protein